MRYNEIKNYIKKESFDCNFNSTLDMNASGNFTISTSTENTYFSVVWEFSLSKFDYLRNIIFLIFNASKSI